MSWMQKLHETYENCADKLEPIGDKLWPISHMVKNTHVEITLDGSGSLRRVKTLDRSASRTLIPVTESSAGRTSGAAAHPLADEIGYCAGDYPKAKRGRFELYEEQLSRWCSSPFTHSKAQAVLDYIRKKTVWSDLNNEGVFPLKVENSQGGKTKLDDGKVFVRWVVEDGGDRSSEAWGDRSLIDAWISFDNDQHQQAGFCIVNGKQARLAQNHPRFVRFPGDGGKLVSSNDFDGYTFRGKFTDCKSQADKDPSYQHQSCSVGFEVSQKAHNTLRWLVSRQGYRKGDQAIVAWSVGGKKVPDPFQNSFQLFDVPDLSAENESCEIDIGDAGQSFSLKLSKALAGYRAHLNVTDDIVVIGLDSATPGRMAIVFYREMNGSEFLDRVEAWHEKFAWLQNFGENKRFVGTPAPRDITEAAFGRRDEKGKMQVDAKLQKAAIERLLPCVIDGRPFPRDLVETTVRRATSRQGMKYWDWEKCLGIACSLFRGCYKEGRYQMALERDRASRDYLYGRLLAIADNIEGYALTRSEKGRDTMAGRLMQRFANRPFSTWRNIELALTPYKSRLRASEETAGFLCKREKLLDEVLCTFQTEDFTNDSALSGEFLLGFHCQRSDLFNPARTEDSND